MLDQIMSAAKGELVSQLTSKLGVGQAQVDQTISTTQDSILGGLQDQLSSGNVQGLLSLFQGKGGDIASNPIVTGIAQQVATQLAAKVGFAPDKAAAISQFAVPFVMSKFTQQAGGPNFDQSQLMSLVGDAAKDQLLGAVKNRLPGGIADKLGGLFG